MAQPIKNYKIITTLKNQAKVIESKMKVLETRRGPGTRLLNSISFIYDSRKGAFIFNAVYYGKFQDEGTYRGKRETKISKSVWPTYIPRGRGRQGTGITPPLHFTNPMATLDKAKIISIVKPILVEEVKKNINQLIKTTNISSVKKI